jgi:hypothetical protein
MKARAKLENVVCRLREKFAPDPAEIHRRLARNALYFFSAHVQANPALQEANLQESRRLEALLPPRTPEEEAEHQAKLSALREDIRRRFGSVERTP